MSDKVEKLVIIGSGPAGLTAAIYAGRAALEPLMFEGFMAGGLVPGGQLMFTTEVENYPGFPTGITGPEMMAAFRAQAERFGTRFHTEDVTSVDFSQRPFTVKSDAREVKAHAVIISTGARANWLDLPEEYELKTQGGGVSACAVCDGANPAFRDKPLVVVGGGDSAIEEATFLTKYASKVYIVHRRDQFRASKAMQERAFKNPKLEPVWDTVLTGYITKEDRGRKLVSGVKTLNRKTNAEGTIDCGGVFMGIGHTPNTDLFTGKLATDETGYLKTKPDSTATEIEGVFAAGDVKDHVYRQAVTAAGMGCMAALDAERWLAAQGLE